MIFASTNACTNTSHTIALSLSLKNTPRTQELEQALDSHAFSPLRTSKNKRGLRADDIKRNDEMQATGTGHGDRDLIYQPFAKPETLAASYAFKAQHDGMPKSQQRLCITCAHNANRGIGCKLALE